MAAMRRMGRQVDEEVNRDKKTCFPRWTVGGFENRGLRSVSAIKRADFNVPECHV